MELAPFFLMFGSSFAQSIFPVTTTSVSFTLQPIATGTSPAILVPFDVDFTSIPGYENNSSVFFEALNSTWTSEVVVFDDSENFDTFLSLSWPDGEGPGAAPVGQNSTWNACFIALPTLFDQLGISGTGNGSCFDVIQSECLWNILSSVLASWDASIVGQTNTTDSILEGACQWASENIQQSSECFGTSANWTQWIQGYWTTSPTNREPFLLGVEAYNSREVNETKSVVQERVLNQVWPVVILEAEGNYSVQATMTCPYAGKVLVE